jgi:hypothetical protein
VGKEVFKGWAEAVNHHHIESCFCAKPTGTRDAGCSSKLLVNMELVLQGTVLSVEWLEFNHDILP